MAGIDIINLIKRTNVTAGEARRLRKRLSDRRKALQDALRVVDTALATLARKLKRRKVSRRKRKL